MTVRETGMVENPIPQMLIDAAARGVNVTIITNDYPKCELTLPWQFRESNMDATGRYRAAGYDLYVQDRDGDSSWWRLSRNRVILAQGESWDYEPFYHFDNCLFAAEAALRNEVSRRLIEIFGRRSGAGR